LASGANQLRDRFAPRLREPHLHAHLSKRIVMGRFVVDHELVTRTFPEGIGTVELMATYEVVDGKILNAWFLMGPKTLASSGQSHERNARPFVAPELIVAARVCVRSVSESDLPSLLEINSDAEVVQYLGHGPWQTIAEAKAWFARISKQQSAGSALEFVIVEKQTAKVIGRCGLFDYDPVDAQASLGYILRRDYWRKGYMREALTSLISCAFKDMGLRRLEAKVEAPNTASSSLLRRLGFTQEGILRERWVSQGGTTDAEVFSLLSHEWNKLAE
jgi:RimJ/RimL family protein N-acetyltransferase